MIGAALIEECVRHGVEVYAVVRASSGKQSRLPESETVHLIDCALEELERLPEWIPKGCDTFSTLPGETQESAETKAQSFRAEIFFIR